jgi:hypothetical protein
MEKEDKQIGKIINKEQPARYPQVAATDTPQALPEGGEYRELSDLEKIAIATSK